VEDDMSKQWESRVPTKTTQAACTEMVGDVAHTSGTKNGNVLCSSSFVWYKSLSGNLVQRNDCPIHMVFSSEKIVIDRSA
jgi:hypothetical protein